MKSFRIRQRRTSGSMKRSSKAIACSGSIRSWRCASGGTAAIWKRSSKGWSSISKKIMFQTARENRSSMTKERAHRDYVGKRSPKITDASPDGLKGRVRLMTGGKVIMKQYTWSIVFVLLTQLLFSLTAAAADIETGHIYRLGATMTGVKEMGVPASDYTALKSSKFAVLGTSDDGLKYLIQFTRIYMSDEPRYSGANWVTLDKVYELPRKD